MKVRASEIFDTSFYAERYRDVKSSKNCLLHYVKFGRFENRLTRDIIPKKRVLDQLRNICEIEPQCVPIFEKTERVVRYPKLSAEMFLPLSVKEKYGEEIKVVVTVPFITVGGADLISTFVVKALQEAYGEKGVLLVVTENSNQDSSDWISNSTNVVVMGEMATFRNDDERVLSLHTMLGLLQPEKVVNINSRTTWKLFQRYGKQLSTAIDLYAYLFCFDYDERRVKVGYITDYLRDSIPYLNTVFCDNKQVVKDIRSLLGFSEENMNKLQTVYVPLPQKLGKEWCPETADGAKKILWVGRLSEQKRPDILIEVAQLLKDYEFHVYGPTGNSECCGEIINGDYSNIVYRGVFNYLQELNVSDYELYLNTSEWEGLPTILIQMMGLGIPIVTTDVGGISELVDDQSGWLVKGSLEPEEIAKTIRMQQINKKESRNKEIVCKERISCRHSWGVFCNQLKELIGYETDSSAMEVTQDSDKASAA